MNTMSEMKTYACETKIEERMLFTKNKKIKNKINPQGNCIAHERKQAENKHNGNIRKTSGNNWRNSQETDTQQI